MFFKNDNTQVKLSSSSAISDYLNEKQHFLKMKVLEKQDWLKDTGSRPLVVIQFE